MNPPRFERDALKRQVEEVALPLRAGDLSDYDPLLDLVGDRRIVMIGDASHGNHEFYRERALITTRLITERGFTMLAVEGDWPEGERVNAYLQGGPGTARDALDVFSNYPTWMWANLDFLHFVEWLRRYNDTVAAGQKVRFAGIDVRNLAGAADLVVSYLEEASPALATEIRQLYAPFAPFHAGLRNAYAHLEEQGLTGRYGTEAERGWDLLRQAREDLIASHGEDAYLLALQAARVVLNGERFYEAAGRGARSESWNIRDIHMVDTLQALFEQYGAMRVVIWEHNTHVGDFRATGDPKGMVNLGQLVRERYPDESIAIGFGTYSGTVTATREWGEQPQAMDIPPADPESYEGIFHETGIERFLLPLSSLRERGQAGGFDDWRGHRAIGVVYTPEDEGENIVPTRLSERYDAFVFLDRTRALAPLREEPTWVPVEAMDTYPSGY